MDAETGDKQIREELEELRRRVAELEAAAESRAQDRATIDEYNHFRNLVENSYDIILVLDGDNTIRYISPSVKRISGFDPEECIGAKSFEFVHPEDQPALKAKISSGLKVPGSTVQAEYRSLCKDGSWFVAESAITNLLQDPTLEGFVIIMRDITEYRSMESKLRESEEHYRHMVENLSDIVFAVDAQGKIDYISPSIEKIIGYTPEELVDASFQDFVHPDDLQGLRESFLRAVNGQAEMHEFRVFDKNRGIKYIRISTRSFEEEGKLLGIVGVMSEITESKQADAARKRSEENFRALIRKQIRYYRPSG